VSDDPHQLAAQTKSFARQLGFDTVGIAPATPSARRDYLRAWLDSGQAGSMEWLKGRFDERTDPAAYLPGCQSIICVAVNYHRPLESPALGEGKVARYALGDDYHELIKSRLYKLADWIRSVEPDAQTRVAVDTAPVMEKELAARAGIGWQGKNTCIINPQIGSWLLLGEVLTTLALPPDTPAIDRCGSCTRCLDACPTQAFTAPYQLDARKCISYLTIEHREEIAAEYHKPIGEWLYGCDICQEVCPWNHKAPDTADPALQPRFTTGTLNLARILGWTSDDYRATLKNSAMKRVKLPILQRNARIVKSNVER
jgi:epoxyqueuosine reductase